MTTEISTEWHIATEEALRSLEAAKTIERRQYPDGDAPEGLLSALLMAVALGRAARMVGVA